VEFILMALMPLLLLEFFIAMRRWGDRKATGN